MVKIKKSDDGQFYFVVVGKNGEVMVTSQMYTRKDTCRESGRALIKLIKENEIEVGDFSR